MTPGDQVSNLPPSPTLRCENSDCVMPLEPEDHDDARRTTGHEHDVEHIITAALDNRPHNDQGGQKGTVGRSVSELTGLRRRPSAMTISDLIHGLLAFMGLIIGLGVGLSYGVGGAVACAIGGFLIGHMLGIVLALADVVTHGMTFWNSKVKIRRR